MKVTDKKDELIHECISVLQAIIDYDGHLKDVHDLNHVRGYIKDRVKPLTDTLYRYVNK